MKVTIFSNSVGGVFYATKKWTQYLSLTDCNVSVFLLTQTKWSEKNLFSDHIQFFYLINSNFRLNFKLLIKSITHQTDVTHINFSSYSPLAIFKKMIFKTPFIYTCHGLPQPWLEPSLPYKIAYTIEHALYSFLTQASAVVAVSNYVKDNLKKKYGLDSEVIYHGIDIDQYKPTNKLESARAKRLLGYREEDYLVLFVGKLHPYKDPLTLIKAVSKIVQKNRRLHLLIVGTGELFREIKNEIYKLNLSSQIILTGYVTDRKLKLCFNAADLFVLPSVNEAFGNVLLEAMARGLPIIASNSGACPEIVGNAGILFNQGDYNELAEKIIDLSYDKELSISLSNAGLKRVMEVFSWKDKIWQYLKLYKSIVED